MPLRATDTTDCMTLPQLTPGPSWPFRSPICFREWHHKYCLANQFRSCRVLIYRIVVVEQGADVNTSRWALFPILYFFKYKNLLIALRHCPFPFEDVLTIPPRARWQIRVNVHCLNSCEVRWCVMVSLCSGSAYLLLLTFYQRRPSFSMTSISSRLSRGYSSYSQSRLATILAFFTVKT